MPKYFCLVGDSPDAALDLYPIKDEKELETFLEDHGYRREDDENTVQVILEGKRLKPKITVSLTEMQSDDLDDGDDSPDPESDSGPFEDPEFASDPDVGFDIKRRRR